MKPQAVLMILDGFGYREETFGNAIKKADMSYYQKLWKTYPHTTLGASGFSVGLPEGQMGNSEVGHLNIGAGRVVYQTYTKIDRAIETGEFDKNPALMDAIASAVKNQSSLHLIGLFSDGGVHSHINHFLALIGLAKKSGLNKIYIHANLDGRDVPPSSALRYVEFFEKETAKMGVGKIASIMGRYYGMDRDNRWERVQKAYDALVCGEGLTASNAREAVEQAYKRGETDEFVLPTLILENGKPVAAINDNDSVIFVNFRPDRARELTEALAVKGFSGFKRKKEVRVHFACMAEYNKAFNLPVAFMPENMENLLAAVLAKNNLSQLRIAETEKYAHVTFFFNGQIEKEFPLEDRALIASPKVPTYDLKPEMSAYEVTDELMKRIDSNQYDVIILNYANPDMVGHTGNMDATVKALNAIDQCLEKSVEKLLAKGAVVLITADHGNADEMLDSQNNVVTSHTTNRVPFILAGGEKNKKLREGGVLADIAPTLLEILKIKKPEEMTGNSLIG